jgi:broad specificity phosphatase PhoE
MHLHLYFIRHGGTEWALSGRHTGLADIPLTTSGEDEARLLEPRLGDVQFTQVFTSPQQRARRTCELAGLSSPAEIDSDLSEWHYGDYEGRRSIDIIKERPGWNLFRDGCPGGESTVQVSDRADRLISRLRELNGNVALFSHGQYGGVLAARWIGLAVVDGQHFPLDTASISMLTYSSSHPDVPVITLWNAYSEKSRLIRSKGENGH